MSALSPEEMGKIVDRINKRFLRLPLDDDNLVIDAIERGNLSLKVACLAAVGLREKKGVPLEVVNIILAYAVPRVAGFCPYIGPRPARERYHGWEEIKRDTHGGGMRAGKDWNASFTSVCPYPLRDNEVFEVRSVDHNPQHHCGVGLVTDQFVPGSNLRFNPAAVVYYIGIELLHNHKPECKITFNRNEINHPIRMSFHELVENTADPITGKTKKTVRRYAAFHSALPRNNPFAFWLPECFNIATQTVFENGRERTFQYVPKVFAGVQVWNNGGVHVQRQPLQTVKELGLLEVQPPEPFVMFGTVQITF